MKIFWETKNVSLMALLLKNIYTFIFRSRPESNIASILYSIYLIALYYTLVYPTLIPTINKLLISMPIINILAVY